MANQSTATISVGGNTLQLERDILRTLNRLEKSAKFTPTLNSRGFSLGRITGEVDDFNRSLDAANKRVLAFGANAAVIGGTIKLFKELTLSTIQVNKALIEINSIFGLSSKELKNFSASLFNTARQTSQSFDVVSKAAQEFARQGLSVEETLKRVQGALTLTRQSGLEITKSVDSITAALNGFAKENLNVSQVVNKLIAVDTRFAVSSADLAEALSRVGNTASDAGVSFDELIGLVTSAQQITARGGAVIGNALKTIFTRVQRSDTLDQLEDLGIKVRDLQNNVLPASQILRELATNFDNLSQSQKQAVIQLTAGTFQVNQLRAILGDLGKQYSIATQAQNVAASATTEATKRNEILNKSLSSLLQNTRTTFAEIGSIIGENTFANPLKEALSLINDNFIINALKNSTSDEAGKEVGGKIASGILSGIANVLTGPGLLFLGAVVGKLGGRLVKESVQSFGAAISGRDKELKTIQGIQVTLSQAAEIDQMRFRTASSIEEKERIILNILQQQNALKAAQSAQFSALASNLPKSNQKQFRQIGSFASGYIPIHEESQAIKHGIGGAPNGAKPVILHNFAFEGGKRGSIVANNSEYIVPNFANGGSAIFNQDMVKKFGLPNGAKKIAAGGYIPNAAEGGMFGGGDKLRSNVGFANRKQLDLLNAYTDLYLASVAAGAKNEESYAKKRIKTIGLSEASQAKVLDALEKEKRAIIKSQEIAQQKAIEDGKTAKKIQAESYKEEKIRQDINKALSALRSRTTSSVSGGGYTPITPTSLYNSNAAIFQSQLKNKIHPVTSSEIDIGKQVNFLSNEQLEKLLAVAGDKASGNRQNDINSSRRILGANLIQKDPNGTTLNTERINSLISLGRSGTLNDLYVDQVKKLVSEGKSLEQAYAFASKSYLEGGGTARQLAKVQAKALYPLIEFEKSTKEHTAQLNQGLVAQKKLQRRQNIQTAGIGASFALPFLAGFVPQGQGGTTAGKVGGAFSGAAQGAGTGLAFGSFFGPAGTIAGGAAGAVIGGLAGYVSKANKSFEEISKTINDLNAKNQEQINSVSSYIQLQQQLNDAIERGAPSKQIDVLLGGQRSALGKLSNFSDRQNVLAAGGDIEKLSQVLGEINLRAQKQAGANDVVSSIFSAKENAGFFKGIKGKDIEEAANALAAAIDITDQKVKEGFSKLKSTFYNDPLGAFKDLATSLQINDEQISDTLKAFKGRPNDLRLILSRFVDVFDKSAADLVKSEEIIRKRQISTDFGKLLRRAGEQNILGAELGQQNSLSQNRVFASRNNAELSISGGSELEKLRQQNEFNIQNAIREAQIQSQAATRKTIGQIQEKASDEKIRQNLPNDLIQKLQTISGPQDFKDLAKSLGTTNEELVKILNDSYIELTLLNNNSRNQIEELKEISRFSEIQARSEQRNKILAGSQFNADTLTNFRNNRVIGRTGQFAPGGRANQFNALNSQIDFADQLGLTETSETQRLRNSVRSGSTRINFAEILSTILRREVTDNKESIDKAISEVLDKPIKNINDAVDQDVVKRIKEGINIASFDTEKALSEINKGGNVSNFVSTGKLSLGEGGLISGISSLSTPLTKINDNLGESGPIASILKQIAENRGIAAENKKLEDSQLQQTNAKKKIDEIDKNIRSIEFKRASLQDIANAVDSERQPGTNAKPIGDFLRRGFGNKESSESIINRLLENQTLLNESGINNKELEKSIARNASRNPVYSSEDFQNIEKLSKERGELQKQLKEITNNLSFSRDINLGAYSSGQRGRSRIINEELDPSLYSSGQRGRSKIQTASTSFFNPITLGTQKNAEGQKQINDLAIDRIKKAQIEAQKVNATYQDRVDLLIALNELELKNAQITNDSYKSFSAGFKSRILEIKKSMNDLSDTGRTVAASLESNLGNSFGDFVTGAQKGKDAFKQFIIGVLNDSARAFASKAVQGVIGLIANSFTGTSAGTGTAKYKNGGKVKNFASGGDVPALVMGGEYYFTPQQVNNIESRYGRGYVDKINKGQAAMYADGGLVKGGSGFKDDVFAMLNSGGYVITKPAVEKYGAKNIDAIANGRAPQKKFWGGFLIGALIGAGTSYATSDKKNRNRNAVIGGIVGGVAGGMAQNYSQTGSGFKSDPNASTFQFSPSSGGSNYQGYYDEDGTFVNTSSSTSSKPQSDFSKFAKSDTGKALIQGGLSLGLGIGVSLAEKKKVAEETLGRELSRQELEYLQKQEYDTKKSQGQFAYLGANNSGGQDIKGYVNEYATRRLAKGGPVRGGSGIRDDLYTKLSSGGAVINKTSTQKYGLSGLKRFAEGGMVTEGISSVTANPQNIQINKSIQPNVIIKIDINNNGETSSSTESDGGKDGKFGEEFAQKLSQNIRNIVKDELIQSKRAGGIDSLSKRNS